MDLRGDHIGRWGAMQLSRFASTQNLRPCWSICQLAVAAGIIGWLTGTASAQTQSEKPIVGQSGIRTQSFAEPFVGQVPVASPLSTNLVQNRPRFTLVPSLRTVYNSNLVVYTAEGDGARDNLRVTPGIDLDYNRLFGRVLLDVRGSAGYDYNSRFKLLNQSRINFEGTARAPVGSVCSAVGTASYTKATFDFNDIQAGNSGTEVGQSSTILNYGITAGCQRSAGFSPVGSFEFQRLSRSRSRVFNSELSVGSLGLLYSQPSVGTLSLVGTYTEIRRPFIAELTGVNDDTNVYDFAVGINRSVSPRLRIDISGGLTRAIPQRASVQSFTGASYNGRVEWLPTSRVVVTGTMSRQVTNQNGISATYVVRENYTLSADFKASAKSQITLAGSRVQRDLRGESLTPTLIPLRTDKLSSLSASYNYDLTSRLRVSLGVSHRWRTADNPIYDYESNLLSSSIGAHF